MFTQTKCHQLHIRFEVFVRSLECKGQITEIQILLAAGLGFQIRLAVVAFLVVGHCRSDET